jgi:hypothetical protein
LDSICLVNKYLHYDNQLVLFLSDRYERIKFELTLPPSARQFLQKHSVAYPAKLLPGYPMPELPPATSDNWPFFISNQQPQPTITPVVLVPHQRAPASVDSYEVNNLIMSSQQKPQSLMTSDELNRKVDQQIKQHWFLLGERQPSASPIPPPHPHHHHHNHHHSHSTSSSPNSSTIKKKNVCFDDTSALRRYSVDDLDMNRGSTPLKSCLKSSITISNDGRHSPTDVSHHIQTQTNHTSQRTRPKSAVVTSDAYQSSSLPIPIEHWRNRQLKSAPGKI